MQKQQKYNDITFFLIAIAFISAFNYYLTYSNISLNGFLILTYSLDTIEGWLAWWACRSIVIYLDKKIPYGNHPAKRILIQFFLTTTSGLVVIISLTELVNWIARDKPLPVSFYSFDVFIFVIWFFFINGIYIGMHYYAEWKDAEHRREEEKKIRSGGFNVKHGKQNLLISFNEILGFYVDDGYCILLTRQQKKYFTDKSLDKIEETLPEEWFFRLNRQYIIHRDSVTGFKRAGDGKIDVMINPSEILPSTILVSRIKAASFKKWFQPEEA